MTEKRSWIYDTLLVAVLILAAYLRVTGVEWGEGQHQHPDELFLSGVVDNLRAHTCMDEGTPIEACPRDRQRWMNPLEYFNTAESTLNPRNRGAGFYVYGNLPVTLVRVAYEMMGDAAGPLKYFGRQFSAIADLFTILILYFIVARLYNRKTALLAALFSSLAVMQIQQSHYFTVDLFMNPFMYAALYYAVRIAYDRESTHVDTYTGTHVDTEVLPPTSYLLTPNSQLFRSPLLHHSLLFGLFLGMAAASKINAIAMAVVLPIALAIRFSRQSSVISDQLSVTSDQSGTQSASQPNSYLLTPNPHPLSQILIFLIFLIIGGLATILSFRIFQPYAFDTILPNEQWIANMEDIQAQATGLADLPWNLQWARRTHLFSFTNLTVWGLGLPLGILAWTGFLVMGWRIFKNKERQHILLWSWTAIYFAWQSMQFNATMRYQLPIYPLLCMMAAWVVLSAYTRKQVDTYTRASAHVSSIPYLLTRIFGIIVLSLTAVYAFAFLSVYTREETRMAASRWIYQNVPGPINLKIQTSDSTAYNQPMPFPTGISIRPEAPYHTAFTAQTDGLLTEISFAHVAVTPAQASPQIYLTVWNNLTDPQPLASTFTTPSPQQTLDGLSQLARFDQPLSLVANQTYFLKLETAVPQGEINVCGRMRMVIQSPGQATEQAINLSAPCIISAGQPYTFTFVPETSGTLSEITLEHVANVGLAVPADSHVVHLYISNEPNPTREQALASASVTGTFARPRDPRGDAYTFLLSQPVFVERGMQYYVRIEVESGLLSLSGANISNETDYDWSLPFRVDGYDAFGGLYPGDLNLQVYWDDNTEKLARFQSILNQTDYIFIPTNHQYGQITRIPERYPLTTLYYRELIGCPADKDIIWCYRVAEPGMFEGRLGFDLIKTFTSHPTLGPIVINDQAAEEAFTFYDHPKVLIFKKRADYDAAKVAFTLSSVDLTKMVRLTPKDAGSYEPPKSLMLPPDRLAQQQAGGTWSQLFDYDSVQNKYPYLGLVVWYLFIFLLGLFTYPLARRALPGLADKGYALSRILGLVLLAYISWISASLGGTYSRANIAVALGLIALVGAWQAWVQRDAIRAEWKSNRKLFIIAEILFLCLFLLDLLIRIGNPDLWHPAKGGERPMDFSYFNAVLKSTSFPPYDPWFAGGYINYYYYGFVIVGTPVKLLGIVPSIAYNFILPTLFTLVGTGAFVVGFNLVRRHVDTRVRAGTQGNDKPSDTSTLITDNLSLITGLSATLLTLILGNLGTFQMLWRAFQRMAAPGGLVPADAGFFQRLMWGLDGFAKSLAGAALPLGRGDWYWLPSRVIPAPGDIEPITEFPLFTFLYSDLHAHMIVLPLALFLIAWGLSFIVAMRAAGTQVNKYTGTHVDTYTSKNLTPNSYLLSRNVILSALPPIIFGSIVLGAVYPTNTWDAFTYIPLTAIAVGYGLFCAFPVGGWKPHLREQSQPSLTETGQPTEVGFVNVEATSVAQRSVTRIPPILLKLGFAAWGALTLVLLARLFYQPYFHWFGSGYGDIDPWRGGHTPISSYFTHWGVFLFLIFAWMIWETREWMAATPLSSLAKLKPYQLWIDASIAAFVVALIYLLYREAVISLIALPMAFWAAILILRPGQTDAKRWVLFMIGTSLALTIAVEIIVLVGDIGRMNTVFKLYLQGWAMLSVSAAAALGWVLPAVPMWKMRWRGVWQVGLTLLLAGAAFFTMSATMDKIRDRMNPEVPHSLDSMEYMRTSQFWDSVTMDLGQDYRAIRWMQENVQGSPVIIEGNCVEYRWCTRFTIYTGLPGVLGWNWHQRQQRGFVEHLIVENRLAEITTFYTTPNSLEAVAFLKKYNVRYIVVGQVESIYYPGEGLIKFELYDGVYWTEVFRDGQTVIYEVK